MNIPEYWEAQYFQSKMLFPDFVRAIQADALRHAADICTTKASAARSISRQAGCVVCAESIEAEADKLKAS